MTLKTNDLDIHNNYMQSLTEICLRMLNLVLQMDIRVLSTETPEHCLIKLLATMETSLNHVMD